jgi:hypothetical protein
MKKYSVADIDGLRYVAKNIYLWGSANPVGSAGLSRQYKEEEMARVVEEQVRTYMLAGLTAADFIEGKAK